LDSDHQPDTTHRRFRGFRARVAQRRAIGPPGSKIRLRRTSAAFAIAAASVGVATLAIAASPYDAFSVGVVGCSNTTQYAGWNSYGYAALSDVDALALVPNAYSRFTLGGFTFQAWGDPEWANGAQPSKTYDEAWRRSREYRPSEGFDAYWVNPCPHVNDGPKPPDSVWQQWATHIRDRIWEVDPGIPIYWSAMAEDVDGTCQSLEYLGDDVRDWAAEHLDGVVLGPELAPLTNDLLAGPCHVNSAGGNVQGALLVAWFDDGEPPPTTTTTEPPTTTTTEPPTTTTTEPPTTTTTEPPTTTTTQPPTTTTLDPRCERRPSHPACG
jgi:hypothetical protein